MLRRSIKKARQLILTARLSVKASSMYGSGYFAVLFHALRLCRERQFLPAEAFRLGLFNPMLSYDEISKYVSRKNFTKVQKSLNPQSWEPLLKNKGILYRFCLALGIPVPKLYAVCFRETAGWCFTGSILATPDDWVEFFDKKLASEFVIKPSMGAFGKGVKVFGKKDDRYVDSFGKFYTAGEIYYNMISDPEHDSFVIQERLKNHPAIIQLTDTTQLQTARISTVIDSNGRPCIVHTHFKLIMGTCVTDTFEHGLTGNMQAKVAPDSGVLEPAIRMAPDGSGIETVPIHPKTKIPFAGFRLPLWPQACALVMETAPKFLPLRTIGWDVALTPDGPVILEANIWWDPPNHHRHSDEILEALLRSTREISLKGYASWGRCR